VISRKEKYAAKSAAKNISSLASQMITPTDRLSGRVLLPCSRLAAIVCNAPGLTPAGALSGVVWAIAPLCPTQRPMVTIGGG
jgi:hypothetical protein